MANGVLGTADLTATTLTTVYTVPANTFAVVSVNVCNRSSADVTVRIATSATATPTNAEYIEYDVTLVGNGAVERTGVVLQTGQNVVVYGSNGDISAQVFGLETSTV